MKKAYLIPWLEALRSGEYEQTDGCLCNEYGEMCCLGVLIDATIDGEWTETFVGGWSEGWSFGGSEVRLNEPLRKRVGLTLDQQDQLVHLNDIERLDFNKIANWAEENLK